MGKRGKRPAWLRYTVAAVAVGFSLILGLALRPHTYTTPYLYFYPSVLVALWFGGFSAGLFATVLTAITVNWFFLHPYGAFSLSGINLMRSFFFCLSFGLICWLIDARKIRAEQRIERQLRLLNMAFEPVIIRDANDDVVFWNTGAERLYGWKKEEAVGSWIHDLLQPAFPESLEAARSELLRAGLWRGELEHTRKDGTTVRVASLWTLDKTDEKQTYVMEVNFDLTERKQMETALVRSEKLAALGRMAATIAHELNNPLAAVMNSIFLANSDPNLSPETRRVLELADQELRRAAHITAQTLIFCRDTAKPGSLRLPDVIDEVLRVYERKLMQRRIGIQRRQRCASCNQGCDFCFAGSAGEVRQVVSNLVGNAIDALRDDGVLHIRLSRFSALAGDKPRIRLTIADNGCGIRTRELKRVFEPFYTTKESFGTGLGLWVSEQIVSKYGGAIRVRSKPDEGTVFTISFPAQPRSDSSFAAD